MELLVKSKLSIQRNRVTDTEKECKFIDTET